MTTPPTPMTPMTPTTQMPPTPSPAGSGPSQRDMLAAALDARVDRIRQVLDECRAEVPAGLAIPARDSLEQVAERLALGVNHTVVAFFGGTGSGKSSLFNALTHLDFADVGARRPTTSQAAACTWGDDATALLTFLGVDPQRRIRRESALDGSDEDDLAGLVLLDVPDYDSVTTAHALQVDRLVPLADILVWVLDPQKYADAALHDGYLRQLGARAEDMLILVNQMDTVPAQDQERLLADVRTLLVRDGLDNVTLLPVSAVRGDNLEVVRELLVERVCQESNAARTASAQLDQITTRLLPAAAARPLDVDPAVSAELATELLTVGGAHVVEESVRSSLGRMVPAALVRPEPPALVAVEAARSRWLAETVLGLPSVWAGAVDQVVPAADLLASQTGEALASVRLPTPRSVAITLAWWAGVLLAVAGAAALVARVVVTGQVVAAAPLVPVVVLGMAVVWWAGRWRRRRASREADAYASQAHQRVSAVVQRSVVAPVSEVLARHARLWAALRNQWVGQADHV